jgi:hypothetical protein
VIIRANFTLRESRVGDAAVVKAEKVISAGQSQSAAKNIQPGQHRGEGDRGDSNE